MSFWIFFCHKQDGGRAFRPPAEADLAKMFDRLTEREEQHRQECQAKTKDLALQKDLGCGAIWGCGGKTVDEMGTKVMSLELATWLWRNYEKSPFLLMMYVGDP